MGLHFPNRNQIAFVNPQGQLGVVDPYGTQMMVLHMDMPASFHFPAWSPNGQYLAATTTDARGGALVVAEAYAAPEQPLFRTLYRDETERPFYLYWSPDSQAISFLAAHPAGLGLHLAYPADPAAPAPQLLTVGQPCFWQWSPRAEQLLVHTGADGADARLEFIPAQPMRGRSAHVVAEGQPGMFQAPSIAANGDYWAYTVRDSRNSRMVIGCASQPEKLALPHQGGVAFAWSPVQPLLAYICPTLPARHFYGPLHLLDIHTGDVRTLTLADEVVLAFFWSPNGRYIAYLRLDPATFRQVAPRPLTNGASTNGHHPPPAPRRDDPLLQLWVVEVATHERQLLLRFQPSEEFVAQFLPFFDQYALSHRLWSPDSDALVLPGSAANAADDEVQILVVPLTSGTPRPIARGRVAFWSWQ